MGWIRFDKVSEKLGGKSRPTLCRYMKKRGFPQPSRIGGNVVWDDRLVDEWIQEETSKPYEPKPVAIPGPGKRRGRHAKTESDDKNSESTSGNKIAANSNVKKFKNFMFKKGILPLNEIVDDGKLHFINGSADNDYYIFRNGSPAVGVCGSLKRKIKALWLNKDSNHLPNSELSPTLAELFRDFVHLNEKFPA